MKIPAPMIPPITAMVVPKRPSWRASFPLSLGATGGFMPHSSFPRIVPPFREPRLRHRRNRVLLRGIMRGRIEKRQPRMGCVLEVDNIQSCRALIEIVAITTRIEPEKRAEQQPDRRLVRNNDDVLVAMFAHDIHQHRKRACRHRQATLSTLWRESVGVFLPGGRFLGKFRLDFVPRHLLPAAVRNLAQPIAPN